MENESWGGRLRPLIYKPGLFKKWLSTCEYGRSRCQSDRLAISSELRVLDVKEKRVRWEGSLVLRLSLSVTSGAQMRNASFMANIARLRTPGSLQLERLPQTIVDAVNVVQMLGERYLSVDALCIIQNDEDDFEARIPATA